MAFDCQEITGLLTYLLTYMLFICMCIQDQCDCCLGKLEMLRNLTAVRKVSGIEETLLLCSCLGPCRV